MDTEQLLLDKINETLANAQAAERHLSATLEGQDSDSVDDPENHPLIEAIATLQYHLEVLYQDISILAERMSLPLLARDVRRQFESFGSDATTMEVSIWDYGLSSRSLAKARRIVASLSAMFDLSGTTGLRAFRTILEHTPAIVESRGIVPENETQVRNAVFEIVKFAFYDAVRDVPIAQLLKMYKPDIGVRSLKAAAEYKFIDSATELKRSIDEISTDIGNYKGHADWKTFYAVFYMTAQFEPLEKLKHAFRIVRDDSNWELIPLVGRGSRTAG